MHCQQFLHSCELILFLCHDVKDDMKVFNQSLDNAQVWKQV